MENVLQQVWLAVGLATAFILGVLYWRRQHAHVATARSRAAVIPTPVVYRDAPTIRVADSQRVDRTRKAIHVNVGEHVDVLATPFGLPPRFRITVKNIIDGTDLEAARLTIEFNGAQLSCGPLVQETDFNEFVLPRVTRDEHRSSIFYYHERGDALEFMRIKLKSVDITNSAAELEVMQLNGHWPSGSHADA